MGLVSSPSVRSTRTGKGAGAKTGRMRSEREEEEALLSEKRVFEEEEEAGRRIREAMEGETGDLMRLALRIGTLLVEKVDGTMDEGS